MPSDCTAFRTTLRNYPLDRGARPFGGLLAARGAQDEVEALLVGNEKLDQFRVVELVEREVHAAVQLVGALEERPQGRQHVAGKERADGIARFLDVAVDL
jgi:hypothetical protein